MGSAYRHDRQDTVQRVKEAADIVAVIGEHVSLKRAGVNLKGLCPFHSEKTPSFTVRPDRQTYHCFGCGEGGDIFSFMMQYHRMSFAEALKELAHRYNVPLPEDGSASEELAKAKQREALHAANEKAASLYHDQLLHGREAEGARRYLAERGIPTEFVGRFQLGYAPEQWDFLTKALAREKIGPAIATEAGLLVAKEKGGHYDRFRQRILFPIIGLTGRVAGFGGRILGEGTPKYLNSPESPIFDKGRTLFGLHQNREAIRKSRKCLVVEGNFDLLSLVVHGVENVVAPLGTALTANHVRTLRGYCDEAYLLFDGDAAGLKAAMRAVPLFLGEQLAAKVVVLPEGHDPDTFIRAHGAEGLAALLEKARSLPEFVFEALARQHGLEVEGKSRIVSELRAITAAISDKDLQRSLFASHFARKLELPPEVLLGTEPAAKPARPAPAGPAPRPKARNLTRNEEKLFGFLLVHPECIADFLAAGLADSISSEFGHEILEALQKAPAATAGPEHLLDLIQGPEKSSLSRLLVTTPAYADEVKSEAAREMIAWLKKNSLRIRKERLLHDISAAHQSQNEDLMLRLVAEKKELDAAIGG
ncbi:MAG: DNA primase [Thermodesulfobacteriota bacterium]